MENCIENLEIRDARIMYRNFSGNAGRYNKAGNRNFSLLLPEEMALQLQEEGWNVKIRQPRNPDDSVLYHLPITVSYEYPRYAPEVYKVTSSQKVLLNEDTVSSLDTDEITRIDMVVRPRVWTDEATGETHVKAYLRLMYATIVDDPFESLYGNIPTAR